MSKHHLAQHMDKHCITKRFEYHKEIGKNATCKKAYKQKSTLITHLIEKLNKSNFELANIIIRDESEVVYETSVDYEEIAEEQFMRNETVNTLVEQFGEEIYE